MLALYIIGFGLGALLFYLIKHTDVIDLKVVNGKDQLDETTRRPLKFSRGVYLFFFIILLTPGINLTILLPIIIYFIRVNDSMLVEQWRIRGKFNNKIVNFLKKEV